MGLFRRDAFALGTNLQRSVLPVYFSTRIDKIPSHEAALFMALEKEYLKPLGFHFPEKNYRSSLLWSDYHEVSLTHPRPLNQIIEISEKIQKSLKNLCNHFLKSLPAVPTVGTGAGRQVCHQRAEGIFQSSLTERLTIVSYGDNCS